MESHEKNAATTDVALREMKTATLEDGKANGKKFLIKDLDDLFPYIGDFGWYQRVLFLLMIPFATFFAFVYFAQIFMTVVPEEHWCYVPELANLTAEERRNLAIPKSKNDHFDKCQMYDADWSTLLQDGVVVADTKWPTVKCQHGWEYNLSDIPYETIATQLNWVCERDHYPATAQAVFFCGAILGGLIFGWITDKYGRIPSLVGTNLIGFAAGVGTAFSTTFWSFCLCRFLVGMAYDNCFTVMYIVVIEYVGPKWRTFVANMSIGVFFTFAACLLPWIALGVKNWMTYTLIISIPLVLAVFTPMFVPESARWLISKGRIEEAITILKKVEKVNKRKIPDEVLLEFKETATRLSEDSKHIPNHTILDLFRTPRLRKHSILLFLIWMSISMVFDGHVRNVDNLGLDVFLTFTIATATEFPADTLLTFTLDILGRRWLACSTMILSGIFSLLATTVPIGIPSASLAIIGRFAVNISYNIGIQYAAELLPTTLRGQGLAAIHILGYVATILVPYIVFLATIAKALPLLILGVLGIFGGCLCLFLPESTGLDMPQTIEDAENYGRGQKFWGMPKIDETNRNRGHH